MKSYMNFEISPNLKSPRFIGYLVDKNKLLKCIGSNESRREEVFLIIDESRKAINKAQREYDIKNLTNTIEQDKLIDQELSAAGVNNPVVYHINEVQAKLISVITRHFISEFCTKYFWIEYDENHEPTIKSDEL